MPSVEEELARIQRIRQAARAMNPEVLGVMFANCLYALQFGSEERALSARTRLRVIIEV